MALYCQYSDQVGLYAPCDFLDWDNYTAKDKKKILQVIMNNFNLSEGVFTSEFIHECGQVGELFEHANEINEDTQFKLFEYILKKQSEMTDVELQDILEEDSNALIDTRKIAKNLDEKMQREKIYGCLIG
jgi:hypothetical protein